MSWSDPEQTYSARDHGGAPKGKSPRRYFTILTSASNLGGIVGWLRQRFVHVLQQPCEGCDLVWSDWKLPDDFASYRE